jgi:stage II sporulation protein D
VHRRRRLLTSTAAVIGAITVAAGASVVMVAGDPPRAAAAPEIVTRPASGTWIVDGHGYGHGRGMSQWGTRAAAAAGRSGEQILAFYYPGTTRTGVGDPMIRVRVGADAFPQLRPVGGLRVYWGTRNAGLPAIRGAIRWQAAPWGDGLRMRYKTARAWKWWGPALPGDLSFAAGGGVLRVYRNDGRGTDYRGTLRVYRSGSTTVAVNRLRLDSYLRGVVPRESPASWPVQALRAQAVAARTYAYARLRSPLSSRYDICDTTSCQVYGGMTNYRADGSRISGEQASTDKAIAGTGGMILTRDGRPAATEYSASHGGWIARGAPYLPPKKDPYTAGDPYATWSVRVSVAAVGRYAGLKRLDKVQITARDGAGQWGGRVLGATLTGIDGSGKPRAVQVSGSALRAALNVRSNYLRIRTG